MITYLTRFKFFVIAILLAMISISLTAQAQTPSAGPKESSGTAVRPEFRLSDLLAQAARNGRRSTSASSGHTSANPTVPFFNITPAAGPVHPVMSSRCRSTLPS
jgi:hypothetical protein